MKAKRILSFGLAIVFTLLCLAGCCEENNNSASAEHETLAKMLLKALYTCDTELIESCAPEFLWSFYKHGVRTSAWDFVESVDISLTHIGELSNEEILHIENEYANEAEIYFSIDEAHRYAYTVTAYFHEDNGDLDSETETDHTRGIVVAKINGKWYAIFPSL